MDALEAIYTRRSIRKFTAQDIADDSLDAILKAGMLAPSAHNQQPWRFVVVRSAQGRQAIADASPYTKMATDAPVCVIVCGDTNNLKAPAYWPQDCSAAIENMLVAARALGIGSVWTGMYPEQERIDALSAAFALPEGVIPLGAIVLGYPAQDFREASERVDASRVYRERWGQQ